MTRRKIYNYLEKYGDDEADLSLPALYEWCQVFNRAIFDDTLVMPSRIVGVYDPDTYGWCEEYLTSANRYAIGLNHQKIKTQEHLLTILVHELVHLHQFFHEPTDTAIHGKYFFSFRPLVEEAGLELTTRYDLQ